MNKQLDYRNQMFWAVLKVLQRYKTLWENIPVMVDIVKELTDELEKIKETAKIAGVSLAGITEEKNATLESLNDMMYELSTVLSTFSKRTKDFKLHAEVDFPESYLDNLKQSESLRLAERIIILLKDNLEALSVYGITSANIDSLKLITDKYSKAMPLTQSSIAERKDANEKLVVQISANEEWLKGELDKMMVSFRSKSEDFYNAYQSARQVTIFGVRHVKDEPPVGDDKVGS